MFFGYRVAFTRDKALVGFTFSVEDDSVRADLSTSRQQHNVVGDNFAHGEDLLAAITDKVSLWRGDYRQPVDNALRAYLLKYSDSDVADDNTHKQHIPPASDKRDKHGKNYVNYIEKRENVVSKDFGNAFCLNIETAVALTVFNALGDLFGSETLYIVMFHIASDCV